VYGQDDWEASIPALEHFTQYSSSEFAVRPFILKDPDRMLTVIQKWANHPNYHVRRLASEGCRPRLPWAMALPIFKKDPKPLLPILELLKADPEDYVRRSVANNLNDISKDHPDLVLNVAGKWLGQKKETDWIVKHACRTLLKKGVPQAMRLFGFGDPQAVRIQDMRISPATVSIGEKVTFSFTLLHTEGTPAKLRIEYAIDFVKANGSTSRKVFHITENQYPTGEEIRFEKTHSFKERTTRKHYPGRHHFTILINGVEKQSAFVDVIHP
ncbi:MAG: DNA alkylation repair protein, partial [Bacteroidota bacterium]